MFDDKGKLVASELEQASRTPIDRAAGSQKYIGAAVAPPGIYTLKVAVVDEAASAAASSARSPREINGFGQLHATDLLIADNTARGGAADCPRPSPRISPATSCMPTSSSSRKRPSSCTDATVVMEVAQTDAVARARQHPGAVPAGRRATTAGAAQRQACRSGCCRPGDTSRARHLGQRAQGGPGRRARSA